MVPGSSHRRSRRLVGTIVLCWLAAACARPPQRLAGEFPPLTVTEAQARSVTGERVRWGGQLVRTTPVDGQTCFEIISLPLDRHARPVVSDGSLGRFIACGTGFYDPEVYASRRDVTVVGTIDSIETGKVGEATYQFPHVQAETIYLWAPRNVARAYYAEPAYYAAGPWVGAYPYWGWGGYPGWYGPYGLGIGVGAWSVPYYWGPGWWGGSSFWWGRRWGGPRYYYGGRGWNRGGGGWRGGGGQGGGGGGGRRRGR